MNIEQQLYKALILAYEEAKNKYKYNPVRFLQMLNEKGAVRTTTELVQHPDISGGLTRLWEEGRLDLSIEAIIQQKPWRALFSDTVLQTARDKLASLGHFIEEENIEPETQDWTDQELLAAVHAYFEMLTQERSGEKYNKAEVNRRLRAGALRSRTKGSVELRMQNISAVLDELCLDWIEGYKPMKNVGEAVKDRIKSIIFNEGYVQADLYQPTPSDAELEQRVKALSKRHLTGKPQGVRSPKKAVSNSTIICRDPLVKAWVLQNASGLCESCGQLAPFRTSENAPFLEIHHVKLLADSGSDTVENAVAVCPNCHRALHHSIKKDQLKIGLYERIERLDKE
jgi:5-methylcytosine-specific restriction protein A